MNVTVHDSVHVNVHSNVHVNDYGTVHAIIFSSLLFSYLFLKPPTQMLITHREVSSMTALEWFESIADERRRIDGVREQKALLESRLEPHGQALGATGHGGNADKMFSLVLARMRLTDLQELEAKLPDMQRALDQRIDEALDVLYGKSGRGGLAKARSSTDADILCCYYLQGMEWAEIASDVVKPNTEWPRQWCRRRAMLALDYIDRVGIAKLANS